MSTSRPLGMQALDLALAASFRIPFGTASAMGVALAAETARRALNDGLGWIGFHESRVGKIAYDYIPEFGKRLLTMTKSLEYPDLIKSSLSLCAIGVIGWEASNYLLGQPSPLYNKILRWLGPIRIQPMEYKEVTKTVDVEGKFTSSTERTIPQTDVIYHYPVVQWAINYFNGNNYQAT